MWPSLPSWLEVPLQNWQHTPGWSHLDRPILKLSVILTNKLVGIIFWNKRTWPKSLLLVEGRTVDVQEAEQLFLLSLGSRLRWGWEQRCCLTCFLHNPGLRRFFPRLHRGGNLFPFFNEQRGQERLVEILSKKTQTIPIWSIWLMIATQSLNWVSWQPAAPPRQDSVCWSAWEQLPDAAKRNNTRVQRVCEDSPMFINNPYMHVLPASIPGAPKIFYVVFFSYAKRAIDFEQNWSDWFNAESQKWRSKLNIPAISQQWWGQGRTIAQRIGTLILGAGHRSIHHASMVVKKKDP